MSELTLEAEALRASIDIYMGWGMVVTVLYSCHCALVGPKSPSAVGLSVNNGCCSLHQVKPTLQNFFSNVKLDLYLLQIDTKTLQLGGELVYELVDDSNKFPHFYGPSRSFAPLPFDAVTKAEKLSVVDGQFSCNLLN
ncbi:boron transporter 1-like [Hibiscus syriacus]|uniref:Boron transporter 1-like n=1 Tax=Hibiscus syriacus TaxID=106335 RepID=A0A6A2YQU1_HIBSY|nr:boron transporter 1-like [Hibiscus syriacus]